MAIVNMLEVCTKRRRTSNIDQHVEHILATLLIATLLRRSSSRVSQQINKNLANQRNVLKKSSRVPFKSFSGGKPSGKPLSAL